MDVVAVVASAVWAAVDDPEVASVRASVWANASLQAAMVSAAIRVRALMTLWRQVAVKPVSPEGRKRIMP
jgi:hypothetical protein